MGRKNKENGVSETSTWSYFCGNGSCHERRWRNCWIFLPKKGKKKVFPAYFIRKVKRLSLERILRGLFFESCVPREIKTTYLQVLHSTCSLHILCIEYMIVQVSLRNFISWHYSGQKFREILFREIFSANFAKAIFMDFPHFFSVLGEFCKKLIVRVHFF